MSQNFDVNSRVSMFPFSVKSHHQELQRLFFFCIVPSRAKDRANCMHRVRWLRALSRGGKRTPSTTQRVYAPPLHQAPGFHVSSFTSACLPCHLCRNLDRVHLTTSQSQTPCEARNCKGLNTRTHVQLGTALIPIINS